MRRWMSRLVRGCGGLVAVWLGWTLLQVSVVRFVDPPLTLTMVQRWAEGDGMPDYRPIPLVDSGPTARAFVASEDARFFLHQGFDWKGICQALERRADGGRLVGASTITQQVAKNVFLWQGRSWVRKGLEAWYVLWLELLVPKERILELYLSVAETGTGTFGVESGARLHFGRSAIRLSNDEAGRLAGILPNPRERSVTSRLALERARFVAAHPAPFPGDAGFEPILRQFQEEPVGPWGCLY